MDWIRFLERYVVRSRTRGKVVTFLVELFLLPHRANRL